MATFVDSSKTTALATKLGPNGSKPFVEQKQGLGRGRPHSEAAMRNLVGTEAPALSALQSMKKCMVYVMSLEFAVGNLDQIQEKQAGNRKRDGGSGHKGKSRLSASKVSHFPINNAENSKTIGVIPVEFDSSNPIKCATLPNRNSAKDKLVDESVHSYTPTGRRSSTTVLNQRRVRGRRRGSSMSC